MYIYIAFMHNIHISISIYHICMCVHYKLHVWCSRRLLSLEGLDASRARLACANSSRTCAESPELAAAATAALTYLIILYKIQYIIFKIKYTVCST